ncbi:DNA methyltransferase [Pseudosulfitobacter sp. SM2401]|uniref:class I SAM-dependent DNA methyltransferase n=1 Tax=Pseudosulfitobacter sp. SM2401 TaxID=3350098 RepID=UPI0036F26D2F
MNAVEIEEAITDLAEQPFDADEFPYDFLLAFGNKETTIKRLRTGATNKSDQGGVLQTNNIHLKTCANGEVGQTLTDLKASPTTTKAKAKFILATDGFDLEAEDITTGETIACAYIDFPDHFGFFLPLAGISTVKQIRESAFDIRATSRLNRLYIKLIEDNSEWGTSARRPDMNHFMARLIFCFFAEDTDIFVSDNLFTATIDQMSNRDGSNTHEIISEIFRAMNTAIPDRAGAKLPRWADAFPYVNGGLFSGSTEAPHFSKIAQRYLSHIGSLDWTQINPDIFGSMIQAVADDEERGALGMHYTSVPNILKVLNPLFLDDLREALEAAGDNARKLANLRARMAKIRVFDPACGSGNFLVIAYKEIRALEFELNKRSGEPGRRSDIPLTNYRGIELRDFSAEIARLALIIAEYQCDVTYLGQKEALAEFLPLDARNWITCGNALRLDWLSICPPTGTGVKFQSDDLFMSPLEQAQIDFENEGGETYICGNPPYLGSREQSTEQKEDLGRIFDGRAKSWKSLDYVAGWFMKAADYGLHTPTVTAFVSTNSICQGQQVPILWPLIFETGHEIAFAHTSFKWANLASHNAGVTVAIVGISNHAGQGRKLYALSGDGEIVLKESDNINAYLVAAPDFIVTKRSTPLSQLTHMNYGNYPGDGNHLTLSGAERIQLLDRNPELESLIRPVYGAQEFIKGLSRYCLWIDDEDLETAQANAEMARRIEAVKETRLASRDKSLNKLALSSHQYRDRNTAKHHLILVPTVSSESRDYIPTDLKSSNAVTTNQAFALYDAPLWNMALIASRIHLVWIATICGKMKTDFRYSNTMGWNCLTSALMGPNRYI